MASHYVSTGHLPDPDVVRGLLAEAHERFRDVNDGVVSTVYPALARVPANLFGLSVVGASGRIFEVGDATHEFSIMSVSKPFVLALVCDAIGFEEVRAKVGVNATGRAFNSVAAIELDAEGRTNPMVNAGAIATSSLVPGANAGERWKTVQSGLSAFAGRELAVDAEIFESASDTNFRNRSIVNFLKSVGRVYCDPVEALDLYTRQCSLNVSAHDLAVMGATLADGGVNPLTGKQVVSAASARYALAVMATAGLYETSGEWLCDIGLPGKSGIGGGVVTVSPGKGGLGTFGARLDPAGNSVRGVLAAKFLSEQLGMDMFMSVPMIDINPANKT